MEFLEANCDHINDLVVNTDMNYATITRKLASIYGKSISVPTLKLFLGKHGIRRRATVSNDSLAQAVASAITEVSSSFLKPT